MPSIIVTCLRYVKNESDNKVNLHYVRIFVSAHDAELLKSNELINRPDPG